MSRIRITDYDRHRTWAEVSEELSKIERLLDYQEALKETGEIRMKVTITPDDDEDDPIEFQWEDSDDESLPTVDWWVEVHQALWNVVDKKHAALKREMRAMLARKP